MYANGTRPTTILWARNSSCITKLKKKSATNLLMPGIRCGVPLRALKASLAMSANQRELTTLHSRNIGNTHTNLKTTVKM